MATALMGAAAASANTVTEYHTNAGSRDFSANAGGWAGSKTQTGICVGAVLTCPDVSNTFQAAGGSGGSSDGFLRSRLGALVGAASHSSAVWTSPAFTYNGAGGKAPDELTFSLARRDDTSTLLSVAGNTVDYSVQVLSGTSGDNVAKEIVDQAPLSAKSSWVTTTPVDVGAGALTIGSQYRLRIVTRFVNGVAVIPATSADYDNVSLRAVDETTDSGNGQNGNNGNNGSNGHNGQNAHSGLSVHEVRSIIEKGLPNTATVSGGQVFVALRCPNRVKGRCRYAVVGLERRGGARTTLPRFARIHSSKTKRLGLSVRAGSRASMTTRKRQLFRIRVRALGRTTTYFRSLRLVHAR